MAKKLTILLSLYKRDGAKKEVTNRTRMIGPDSTIPIPAVVSVGTLPEQPVLLRAQIDT